MSSDYISCDHCTNDVFSSLRRANDRFMKDYRGPPAVNGSKGLVILTCMDSRIPVLEMLGLSPGEALIIRNAGNAITDDTLRSLLICLSIMGCNNVLIIGHTRCGMRRTQTNDPKILDIIDPVALSEHLGLEKGDVREWFGFFEGSEEEWVKEQAISLRRMVERIMPARHVVIRGAVFDLSDGRVAFL